MIHKLITQLSIILFESDLIMTRITLGFSELLWFILLIWQGDTFNRPTYHNMSLLFSENTWALIFLVSAFCQFKIALKQEFHTSFSHIFAAWNASLWIYIVGSMLLSVYPPPAAIAGEIALAFSALLIWMRPYLITQGLIYGKQ